MSTNQTQPTSPSPTPSPSPTSASPTPTTPHAAPTGGGTSARQSLRGQPLAAQEAALAPGAGAAGRATFTTRIRSANTPAAMTADRITPGRAFAVHFTLSGHTGPVELLVEGGEGAVRVAGEAVHRVTQSGRVELDPAQQTNGMVTLVARQAGQILGRSNAFAVAAIPTAIDITGSSAQANAAQLLMVVQTATRSDSNDPAHLDRVFLTERVERVEQTGSFAGLGITQNPEAPMPASQVIPDTHWTPRARLQEQGGRFKTQQTFMFRDARTGASGVPVARSGFLLDRQIQAIGGGQVAFQITKSPHAGSAMGVRAAAGIVSGEAHQGAVFPAAPATATPTPAPATASTGGHTGPAHGH